MPAEPQATRVLALGDRAVLVEFGDVIDEAVNRRALRFAAGLAARAVPGIRDIVPAYAAVAVHFDPLRTRAEHVIQALEALLERGDSAGAAEDDAVVRVPCCYGGAFGPDLAGVAAWANCSEAAVIARHAAPVYRVCMIGFLPGFPYMAAVDATIAAPRHATPRLTVPAGSVAIAGRQTGIYPVGSPGGWQIVGRTPVRLFDPSRTPPARLVPGTRVRFVPVEASELEALAREDAW
jgi:KipI family sensor histidine kinase inhibitor